MIWTLVLVLRLEVFSDVAVACDLVVDVFTSISLDALSSPSFRQQQICKQGKSFCHPDMMKADAKSYPSEKNITKLLY